MPFFVECDLISTGYKKYAAYNFSFDAMNILQFSTNQS